MQMGSGLGRGLSNRNYKASGATKRRAAQVAMSVRLGRARLESHELWTVKEAMEPSRTYVMTGHMARKVSAIWYRLAKMSALNGCALAIPSEELIHIEKVSRNDVTRSVFAVEFQGESCSDTTQSP